MFFNRDSLSLWFGNCLTLTKLCFLIPLNCFSQTCLSVCFLTDLFICINSIMSSLPSFKEKFTLSGVMIHLKKKMSQSLYGLFWPRIYNQTYILKCGLGASSMGVTWELIRNNRIPTVLRPNSLHLARSLSNSNVQSFPRTGLREETDEKRNCILRSFLV